MSLSCSICTDNLFTNNLMVVSTQCGHLFHYSCIEKWLDDSERCPYCLSYVDEEELIKIHAHYENDLEKKYEEIKKKQDEMDLKIKKQEELLHKMMKKTEKQAMRSQVPIFSEGSRSGRSLENDELEKIYRKIIEEVDMDFVNQVDQEIMNEIEIHDYLRKYNI